MVFSDALQKTLCEVIVPLIEADGGKLYVVPNESILHLHLAGACSGCPGAQFTINNVIRPLLEKNYSAQDITVSVGWLVPEGAEQLDSPRQENQ